MGDQRRSDNGAQWSPQRSRDTADQGVQTSFADKLANADDSVEGEMHRNERRLSGGIQANLDTFGEDLVEMFGPDAQVAPGLE